MGTGPQKTLMAAFSAYAAASIVARPVQAEDPDKPVRIMLPFGAGGIADVTMRLVAGKLSERMGAQFVVENKPGAGGINAAMAVKSAASDGYTLLLNGNGSALS